MNDPQDSAYFATRYAPDRHRGKVWAHLTRFLSRQWIPADADVLELGAGYCDFTNALRVASRTAMDIDDAVRRFAAPGVRVEVGDSSDLTRFASDTFDVVFASNLLEHLAREQGRALLLEALRVLRPGGRIILLQPNYRLRPHEYFDDYTHVTVYSDRSLRDVVTATGFEVVAVTARFLPQSLRSRFTALTFLVPVYLRSPIRPLAGQMLLVAKKPTLTGFR